MNLLHCLFILSVFNIANDCWLYVGCCSTGRSETQRQRRQTAIAAATERPSWQETSSRRLCTLVDDRWNHFCCFRFVRLRSLEWDPAEDWELGERSSAEDREMEQRHGDEHTSAVCHYLRDFAAKKSVISPVTNCVQEFINHNQILLLS